MADIIKEVPPPEIGYIDKKVNNNVSNVVPVPKARSAGVSVVLPQMADVEGITHVSRGVTLMVPREPKGHAASKGEPCISKHFPV